MGSDLQSKIGALFSTQSYWGGVVGYFVGVYVIDFLLTINAWTDIQYFYSYFTEITCAGFLALTTGGLAGWWSSYLFTKWTNSVIQFCVAILFGLLFSLISFPALMFIAAV